MKNALFILACALLPAAGRAQEDLLPRHDLPVDLRPAAETGALLFNGWVKASVVSHNPLLRNDSALWFDFDRIGERLVATADKENAVLFNKREFQSVTFYTGRSSFTFEHVPAINDKDIFYALVKTDDRYSLYRSVTPEPGNGGYHEPYEYFIVFPFPDVRVLRLKVLDRRLLRHAFALNADRQKLDRYYALHPNEEQGEHFLKGLIEFLNEE